MSLLNFATRVCAHSECVLVSLSVSLLLAPSLPHSFLVQLAALIAAIQPDIVGLQAIEDVRVSALYVLSSHH